MSDDRRAAPPPPMPGSRPASAVRSGGSPLPVEDERPVSELGYAEASGELEAIIGELDQGLVDVDHLEVRFRRAIEIVEELDRRIHRAKDQVDALLPRLGAVGGAESRETAGREAAGRETVGREARRDAAAPSGPTGSGGAGRAGRPDSQDCGEA